MNGMKLMLIVLTCLVAPVKKSKQIQMTEEQDKLFGIKKLNISRSEIPAVTHVDYSARIQTVIKKNRDIISLYLNSKKKQAVQVL